MTPPFIFFPDEIHEPYVTLPYNQGYEDEIGVAKEQFDKSIEGVGYQTRDIGNDNT
jgi:hypothetical protein